MNIYKKVKKEYSKLKINKRLILPLTEGNYLVDPSDRFSLKRYTENKKNLTGVKFTHNIKLIPAGYYIYPRIEFSNGKLDYRVVMQYPEWNKILSSMESRLYFADKNKLVKCGISLPR